MKALGQNNLPPSEASQKPKLNSRGTVAPNQGSCTVTLQTTMLPLK